MHSTHSWKDDTFQALSAMPMGAPVSLPHPTLYLHETWPETPPHHAFHIPAPYFRHKLCRWLHNTDNNTHVPSTDVRETIEEYHLDIELPGIADKSQIRIRWTSTRTLLIQARIDRPHLSVCSQRSDEDPEKASSETKPCICSGSSPFHFPRPHLPKPLEFNIAEDIAKGAMQAFPPPNLSSTSVETGEPAAGTEQPEEQNQPKPKPPHLTVNERQIGYFVRNFEFPVDIDHMTLKANLQHGLLTITVTKMPHERPVKEDVEVNLV